MEYIPLLVVSILANYGIAEGELWKHAVTSAVAAQLIARDKGDDEDLAFTAALLHDIGKIILGGALILMAFLTRGRFSPSGQDNPLVPGA